MELSSQPADSILESIQAGSKVMTRSNLLVEGCLFVLFYNKIMTRGFSPERRDRSRDV